MRNKSNKTEESNSRPDRRRKQNPETFQATIDKYQNHDGTAVYINRVFPIIDRSLTGNFKYIEKMEARLATKDDAEPVPPYPNISQHVRDTWGGGVYKIYFTDQNRPTDARELARCILEFPISEFEPVLNPKELVRGPEKNEQFIQHWIAKGKIYINEETGGIEPVIPGQTPPSGDTRAALEFAKEVMNKENAKGPQSSAATEALVSTTKSMVDYALKAADPIGMLEKVAGIVKLNGGSDNSAVLVAMIQSQAQERQMFMQWMMDQQRTKAEQNGRPRGGLDDAVNILDKLASTAEKFGINLPHSREKETSFFDQLLEKAPQLIMTYFAMRAGQNPQGMLGELTPSAPTIAAAPASTAEPQAAAPAAAPSAAPSASVVLMQQLHSLGVRTLDCLRREKTGSDLAYAIDTFHGHDTYLKIQNFGKEAILKGLASFPDIWRELEPLQTQLEEFIDEFLTAFNDEEENPANVSNVPTGATA